MRRIAIFAHYDRDGIVDEYVLYYLRGLRQVADRILFVSDCSLAPGEAAKLEGIAELVSASRHGGYDYGSWQRGIASLGTAIDEADELILANDSCYAPIYPFEGVFARMDAEPCECWGVTGYRTDRGFQFLNSYFLVFRRAVLADPAFRDFWAQIVPRERKHEVVFEYEMGLSRLLISRGHILSAVVPPDPIDLPLHSDYVRRLMGQYRSSWLKVRLFSENPKRVPNLGAILAETGRHYPRKLIDRHLRRLIGTDDPPHYHFRLGEFRWQGRGLRVTARTRRDRWWKLYVVAFGIPIFVVVLPLSQRVARVKIEGKIL